MPSLYDDLASVYDATIDWPARLAFEMPFVQRELENVGARNVLVAACGTGGHVVELARQGFRATGTDLSPNMIVKAREKVEQAKRDGPAGALESVKLVVSGFEELPSTVGTGFDAVLCLGNSLPHLVSDDALSAGLAGIRGCLRPDGVFITQNLNYDKRWREKATFFPLSSGCVNGQEFILFKTATYHAEYLDFHIAVLSKGSSGWEYRVDTARQRPLRRDPFVALLADTGFTRIQSYGSLKGVRFDAAESWDLVVVAHAPTSL